MYNALWPSRSCRNCDWSGPMTRRCIGLEAFGPRRKNIRNGVDGGKKEENRSAAAAAPAIFGRLTHSKRGSLARSPPHMPAANASLYCFARITQAAKPAAGSRVDCIRSIAAAALFRFVPVCTAIAATQRTLHDSYVPATASNEGNGKKRNLLRLTVAALSRALYGFANFSRVGVWRLYALVSVHAFQRFLCRFHS